METKCCEPSRAPSPDFSSDDNSDDEGPSDFCESFRDITPTNLPLTQKKKLVMYRGVHRDKESLLEELMALQDALQDQKFHYNAHREHHNAVKEENSRLGKIIEFLETSGLQAALTGSLTKLKSKLKGCKARIVDLETTCSTNAAEIRNLRFEHPIHENSSSGVCTYLEQGDLSIREVTVERELFAQEVRRLQRCVFHLGKLHKRVSDGNNEATRLKAKITTLTAKNPELATSASLQRKSVENMAKEAAEWTAKGAAAKVACARDNEKYKRLQEESKSIMDVLSKLKLEKAEVTTKINTLSHQVRLVERDTREKARNAPAKRWGLF